MEVFIHVSTLSAAQLMTAQRVVEEFVMLTENVNMMDAAMTLTVRIHVMDSVLTDSAAILESAAQMTIVEGVVFAQKTSPAPLLNAAQTQTVLSIAMASVDLMAHVRILSVVRTLTVSMLMVFVMFPHPMTKTSVTIVTMGNVKQDVLMMVWEVQTVPPLILHVMATFAAVLRAQNVITLMESVT